MKVACFFLRVTPKMALPLAENGVFGQNGVGL